MRFIILLANMLSAS